MAEGHTVLVVKVPARRRARLLEREGYAVIEAASGRAALAAARQHALQAAVVELPLPDMDAAAVLEGILATRPGTPVLLIAEDPDLEQAVDAIKRGAREFLVRPVRPRRLLALLAQHVRLAAEQGSVPTPASAAAREMAKHNIIGHSRAMLELFDTIKQVAPHAARVLVLGESGTGKELVARALHDLSPRSAGPFVPVNCATLSEEILESDLFGHERGAFTSADRLKTGLMEAAHGGTLFLDEVNEMGAACQAKMLRVLERMEFRRVGGTKKIRVAFNLITATNVDLEGCVAQGRFRADLYYRLKVLTLEVPPLRSRTEAIPILAGRFLHEVAAQMGLEPKRLSREALARMLAYRWPGNIRELRNCMEGLTLTVKRPVIQASDLPAALRTPHAAELRVRVGTRLSEVERELIRLTLAARPTIREAARSLGIGLRTLYTKMRLYGIPGRRTG